MRMWCQVAWTVAPPYVAAERRLTQPGRHVGRRYQRYFTEITKEPYFFDNKRHHAPHIHAEYAEDNAVLSIEESFSEFRKQEKFLKTIGDQKIISNKINPLDIDQWTSYKYYSTLNQFIIHGNGFIGNEKTHHERTSS